MRSLGSAAARRRSFVALSTLAIVLSLLPGASLAAGPLGSGVLQAPVGHDPEVAPYIFPGREPLEGKEEDEDEFLLKQDDATITRRTAGDRQLSIDQAALHRSEAATAAHELKATKPPISPLTYTGPWTEISPDPIVQVSRGTPIFYAVSGRVSALAIRPSNGLKILGGAQGGIWTYDDATGTWTPRTDNQKTISIGAIAIAPSDDSIIYAGTGEGNLSGDSYFGRGFLKSTDGGMHWASIGGSFFTGVSISKVVVDPNDPNHLYAGVIRGRAGSRRQTPPFHEVRHLGIQGRRRALEDIRKAKDESTGPPTSYGPPQPKRPVRLVLGRGHRPLDRRRPDLGPVHGRHPRQRDVRHRRRHPLRPGHLASGRPGGRPVRGLRVDDRRRRSALADLEVHQRRRVAASAQGRGRRPRQHRGLLRQPVLLRQRHRRRPDQQCVVYALGLFNYGTGSGGVFRSTDGGPTWKDLGWDLHPDYHAIAIDPSDTSNVMIGNDGGVWFSGRRAAGPARPTRSAQ